MGYSDIGSYGSEIATPNLDRLATTGIRFTQFYNASRCCPSRAALLTGLYPHQTGLGDMVGGPSTTLGPGYGGRINPRCVTLAQVLKTSGYATYMVGKWHVTPDMADTANMPLQRGFDRFFGLMNSPYNYFDSKVMINGNKGVPQQIGTYSTYHISDTAAAYIDQHVSTGKTNPFFLYVAHNAPHYPLQAPDSLVAKYRGKYLQSWYALRDQRYARQLASGLINPLWSLSGKDGASWDSLSAAKKAEMDFRMAIYAAQMEAMDQGIGTVLKALDRNSLTGNTLVIFLADNGGNYEGGLLGSDSASYLGKHVTPSTMSYGQSWGNVSNTPFRKFKHFTFEGGIATPMIAAWPNGIVGANRWETQPGHIIDLMPTVAELAGAAYPSQFKGNTIIPMEGVSLVPALAGKTFTRSQPLFWEHEGSKAIRDGKWKLVTPPGGKWELYDLELDRNEMNNLALIFPDRVSSMTAQWTTWAKRTDVIYTPSTLKSPSRGGLKRGEVVERASIWADRDELGRVLAPKTDVLLLD
jgi:arylsulfatase